MPCFKYSKLRWFSECYWSGCRQWRGQVSSESHSNKHSSKQLIIIKCQVSENVKMCGCHLFSCYHSCLAAITRLLLKLIDAVTSCLLDTWSKRCSREKLVFTCWIGVAVQFCVQVIHIVTTTIFNAFFFNAAWCGWFFTHTGHHMGIRCDWRSSFITSELTGCFVLLCLVLWNKQKQVINTTQCERKSYSWL